MKRLISVVFLLIQILFELHAQSYEELGDIFVHSAYTLYNRQIKKFPTEKQNVSLKHILT